MAKSKPIESKATNEKILQLIPSRPDLMVNFAQAPAAEGQPATTVSKHCVAIALCENTDGEQYVRALTVDDLTGFSDDEALTFTAATV